MPVRWVGAMWTWIRYSPLHLIIAAGTALVLVAGAIVGSLSLDSLHNQCGAGYYLGSLHECIGVTDGRYDFIPALHDVDQAVYAENLNATTMASQEHDQPVTVALLLPLTSTDPAMQTEIVQEVQGAYVAQYRANHDANGEQPPIRLVLANPGTDSAQYLPVVQELAGMTGAPDNLRAVAGISVSTDTTKAEVGWLTAHGVPVVGGAITADDIANTSNSDPFHGLARVEPVIAQEAQALVRLGKVDRRQAVLVEDTRTDDDYITALAQGFSADSAYEPREFQSAPDENQVGDTANTFESITVPYICGLKGIKWIYFAGRHVQLRLFINALTTGCPGGQFTILTGADASHLSNDPDLDTSGFSDGITLEYAAIAAPGIWGTLSQDADGKSPEGYAQFLSTIEADNGKIGPVSLIDGQSIINYDAILTAIAGIRTQTSASNPLPSLAQVANGWGSLSGTNTVAGASGQICLDNAGNPYDKPVPVIQYSTLGKPVPLTAAWPTGSPPTWPCIVPSAG
jgi:hypothetical protein